MMLMMLLLLSFLSFFFRFFLLLQPGDKTAEEVAPLLGLEEKDSAVAEVEVDEVLGLVSDEAAEVTAYDAMPCWALALIERLLDVLCDILLHGELGHGLLGNFNSLLLHILSHIGTLDLGFQLLPGSRGKALLELVAAHGCDGDVGVIRR